MAITVNTDLDAVLRTVTGQDSSNQTLFKLQANRSYTVNCYPTSAGTATMKVGIGDGLTDFSTTANAYDGTQTAAFSREVKGATFVGLLPASGTWTIEVRRA